MPRSEARFNQSVPMTIKKCSACGQDHDWLYVYPVNNPDSQLGRTQCPNTGKELIITAEVRD